MVPVGAVRLQPSSPGRSPGGRPQRAGEADDLADDGTDQQWQAMTEQCVTEARAAAADLGLHGRPDPLIRHVKRLGKGARKAGWGEGLAQ